MAELPKPEWLSLSKALVWVVDVTDADRDDAAESLYSALRDEQVEYRGRGKSYTGHDTQTQMHGIALDQAKMDWDNDRFTIPSSRSSYLRNDRDGHLIEDVEVCRLGYQGLEEWLQPAQPKQKHVSESVPETAEVISTSSEKIGAPGRPKGSGAIDDNELLSQMAVLLKYKKAKSTHAAAEEVSQNEKDAGEFLKLVGRLCRKYPLYEGRFIPNL